MTINIKSSYWKILLTLIMSILIIMLIKISLFKPPNHEDVIHLSVKGVSYFIPKEYLSYKDDFEGGKQETATINVLYPSLEPIPPNMSWSKLYQQGEAIRVLLHSYSYNDQQVRENAITRVKLKGADIHFDGVKTKYIPDDYRNAYYLTYELEDRYILLRCTDRENKSIGVDSCVNRYASSFSDRNISYLLADDLLSNILEIDKKVHQLILRFNQNSS